MKSTTKTTLLTTLSMLTAVSLIAACGSKKATPAKDEKADPKAAVKVEPGQLAPGFFKVTEVTCSSGVAAKEEGKSFVGSTFEFQDVESRYTLVEKDKTTVGTIKTSKDEKDEKKTFVTFFESNLTPEEGKDATVEEKGTVEYTLVGDDLTFKGLNEEFCAKDETAEIKLKREAKPVAETKPAAPAATAPAPTAPAAEGAAAAPENK